MRKRVTGLLLCVSMVLSMFQFTVAAPVTVAKNSPSWSADLTDWKIAPSGYLTHENTEYPLTETLPSIVSDEEALDPFNTLDNWVDCPAPGTVLGALIDAGKYDHLFETGPDNTKDVFYNVNLSKIPFTDFEKPWWHRTSVTIPAFQKDKKVTLTFKGINYVGEIYVNGNQLSNEYINITDNNELLNRSGAGTEQAPYTYQLPESMKYNPYSKISQFNNDDGIDVYGDLFIGAFRTYELDVTDYINPFGDNGSTGNVIAVKIDRPVYRVGGYEAHPTEGDFAPQWVDWHPTPPDHNMGLIGRVILSTSHAVRLNNPAVASKVAEDYSTANLNFYVEATNLSDSDVTGTLRAVIKEYVPDGDGPQVGQPLTVTEVTIPAGAYNYEIAAAATITQPKLWWTYGMGDQPLYTVDYEFIEGATVHDTLYHRFGIREIYHEVTITDSSQLTAAITGNDSYQMQVYINHRPVLLKGGGYCPTDLFLRHSQETNQAVVDYVKYMGMNVIRDEGKFWSEELMDLLDENGIAFMSGWCCCDRIENPQEWMLVERFLVFEGQYAQMRNHRSHPSMIVWYNGSDAPPDYASGDSAGAVSGENVARRYLEIEGKLRWNEIGVTACSANQSPSQTISSGLPSGQKMSVGYDIVTPAHYFSSPHGSNGFVSEGHGGVSIPVAETLYKMIPEEHLWPYNVGENSNFWNYHANRQSFQNIEALVTFTDNVFGGSETFEEFVAKAQIIQYESQRAQYEALNLYRYVSATGNINWMMTSTRPTVMWNQLDYYMNPNGRTFGAHKGNELVHIMYDSYRKDIWVINNTLETPGNLTAKATIYDIEGNVIGELLDSAYIEADGATAVEGSKASNPNIVVGYNAVDSNKPLNGTTYEEVTATYHRVVESSTGTTKIWDMDDINNALSRPTSDVYFLKLELFDNEKLISRNDYAVPRRQDVGSATNWAKSAPYQTHDLTQLNQLPTIDLEITPTGHKEADGIITYTYDVTNNTDAVAFAVELKAYTDDSLKELITAVMYEDNLFTLYPGETRSIDIAYRASYFEGDPRVTAGCYNNVIGNKPARLGNLYTPANPVNQTATSTTDDSNTRNLARGRQGYLVDAGGSPSANDNVTRISTSNNNRITNYANLGTTPIESDYSARATVAQGGAFYVDLGSPQTFDRVMARWNNIINTGSANNITGTRPAHVRVDISNDGTTWETVIKDFDNAGAASVMTNILLDEPVTAQYVRLTPSEPKSETPAHGMSTGVYPNSTSKRTSGTTDAYESGIARRAAATNFTLNAFEVYNTFNYLYVDFEGGGNNVKVETTGTYGTGDAMASELTADSPDMERTRWIAAGEEITFTLLPETGKTLYVYLNNDEITGDLTEIAEDKYEYVAKNINGYTVLSILTGDNAFYRVIFDENGGSPVTQLPRRVEEGTRIPEPDPPRRAGHSFDGWYSNEALTPSSKWNFEEDAVTADVTLYAKWIPETYTVTFDTRSPFTDNFTRDVTYGSELINPEMLEGNPERDGFLFDGWYKDVSGTEPWIFDKDQVTGALTLYAKWLIDPDADEHQWVVSFESNKGPAVATQFVEDGSTAQEPVIDWPGGTLLGWYTDGETFEHLWDFDTEITADVILYAYWDYNIYEITFSANNGENIEPQFLNYGDLVTEPEAPERDGFDFVQWCHDEDCTVPWLFEEDTVTDDTTLFALWHYTVPLEVRFNTNGGDRIVSQTVIRENTKVTVSNPIRQGYVFAGWYINEDLETPWGADDVVTESMTLYAKWEEDRDAFLTVSFESNGGTSINPITGIVPGATISAPANPTRNGYRFDGWYTDNTAFNQRWDFARDPVTANMTLYAKWLTTTTPPSGGGGGAVASSGSGSSTTNATVNERAVQNQLKNSSDIVITAGSRNTPLQFNNATLHNIADKNGTLTIDKGSVSVKFGKENLTALSDRTGTTNIQVTEPSNYAANGILDNKFNVNITKGTQKVTNIGGSFEVNINMSSESLSQEQIAGLAAYRLNSDGSETPLGGVYNAETKIFAFETDVPGEFVIRTGSEDTPAAPGSGQVSNQQVVLTVGQTNYTVGSVSGSMDVAPVIVEGRTLVPIRFISESLGAQVHWDAGTATVTVKMDDRDLVLTVGQLLDGMDVPPQIMNDRVMVPLRYITENFDAIVSFNETTGSITINR